MPGWVSHVAPYALYAAIPFAGELLPEALRPWLDPLRAVVVAAALLLYWRRGAYPELRRRNAARPGAPLLALGAGVLVAVLWVPLALLVPPFLGERGGFDDAAAGEAAAPALLAGRLLAFVVVVPLAEELFVRDFLPRILDAGPEEDWRGRPVGAFTPLSAGVSVAFFTLTHPEWLAALFTGALWTVLLTRTRRLTDAVVAHAVANAGLAAYVLLSGDTRWW